MPLNYQEALKSAARYCASRERCISEVMDKFGQWGISPEDADQMIERLKKEKFLDEKRYATAYAQQKFAHSHWGKNRIRAGLEDKAIPLDLIDEVLSQISPSEYDSLLLNQLISRFRQMGGATRDNCRKITRQLTDKGFSEEDITRLMPDCIQTNEI